MSWVMDRRVTFSVGHSQHGLGVFTDLLRPFGIDTLVDVRTFPTSKFAQDFSRGNLEKRLPVIGIRYVFLGDKLGGRPSNLNYYDEEGHVLYGRLARDPAFQEGISLIARNLRTCTIALMCSEGHPRECHRHLLIEPVLSTREILMMHIRPQGGLYETAEIETQPPLFLDQNEEAWKSTRSVSRGEALRASSKP